VEQLPMDFPRSFLRFRHLLTPGPQRAMLPIAIPISELSLTKVIQSIDQDSIVFSLDGEAQTPAINQSGDEITVYSWTAICLSHLVQNTL
jgi:hypothetical protein